MVCFYLVLGCFLDSISMLSITLPLLSPMVKAMGIDPIFFGMIMIMAIEAGLITPPVGLNVYATKGVAEADVTLEDIFIGSFPFFLFFLISIPLMIAFPWIITFLPGKLF
jgi:TRAP-type C4-dicarboxylate transport system permease large subunit